MARARKPTSLPPPYLKRVWLDEAAVPDRAAYPFDLPLFGRPGSDPAFELAFDRAVTIIVGENGTGKSTLLEGIAVLAGFDEGGGGPGYRAVDHSGAIEQGGGALAAALKASWLPKISDGWFFRAESFFSVARYLDSVGSPAADFLSYSHGEGFMRFFEERCGRHGLYLFDEPESALSIVRQFDFLKLLHRLQAAGNAQVILATHAPVLMALPGARLLRIDRHGLEPVALEQTDHYRLLREFILDPAGTVETMLEE